MSYLINKLLEPIWAVVAAVLIVASLASIIWVESARGRKTGREGGKVEQVGDEHYEGLKCRDPLIDWGPEPFRGIATEQANPWSQLQYVSVTVDGNDAKACAGDKYEKLMGAAFLDDATKNFKDIPITKSTLYDIGQGTIKLRIPVTSEYRAGLGTRVGVTNYAVLFLPHGVSGDQFSTIREARRFGVKDIHGAHGRP